MICLGRIGRDFRSRLAPLGNPFHATAVQEAHIPVSIVFENPQCPGSKPVVVVAIQYDRRCVVYACASQQPLQVFSAQRRAHNLILKLFLPVEANGSRDVPLLIGRCIHIYFYETNLRIMQMRLDPGSVYQYLWMDVPFVFRHAYTSLCFSKRAIVISSKDKAFAKSLP